MTARLVLGQRVRRTARHTLVVQPIQVQWKRAGGTRILTRSCARPTRLMAGLALLRWGVVELAAQTLHAEAAV